VVVVMVVTVMVVSLVSERRGSEHHQQQSGSENLFHEKNLARRLPERKSTKRPASKEQRGLPKRNGASRIRANKNSGVN
jgi:hypothetical protein